MDAVWRAIGALPLDLKMALLLRDVVGLSYAEIADSLETTLATVKWRIYKARETVAAELAREGYGRAPRGTRAHRLNAALPPVRQPRRPASRGSPASSDRPLRALDVVVHPPPGGRAAVQCRAPCRRRGGRCPGAGRPSPG